MKILKIFIIMLFGLLLSACGSKNKADVIEKFEKKINSVKSYKLEGNMEIYSNEDKYTYNVEVDYKYEELYKVKLTNKVNGHEQVILRNNDGVYVITPALNKSFKFQSEWPNNSSQSYLLQSLLYDIQKTDNPTIDEDDNYYIVTANVKYPNNSNLVSEKIYFDKKNNLKYVHVLNKDGNAIIKMDFGKIKYSIKFEDDNFDIKSLISDSACDGNNTCENETEKTSIVDNIVYPLYLPKDTYLSTKDTIETDTGDRVVMTYSGGKPFMIIEEPATVSKEMEITSVYGEPYMLSSAIGAISENSIEWQSNNMEYYITSSYLTSEELSTIAESLNTAQVVEIKNK